MDALNQALNAAAWWRLLLVGFLTGIGVAAAGIWLLASWASGRPYMPGPFGRSGDYRMSPPK